MAKLVIVTGANGALGNSYVNYFSRQPDTRCIAIGRNVPAKQISKAVFLRADLLQKKQIENEINRLSLEGLQEIILIHAVGKFGFDKQGSARFDPQILESNIDTFKNIANPLLRKINASLGKKPKVTLCAFGSVSDKYDIPAWRSYSAAKNHLRRYIQKLSSQNRLSNIVSGVFVNVSTVHTENEEKLRPFGNKKYWLSPDEIVKQSAESIARSKGYLEMDLITVRPGFDESYYRDLKK